jgi:hypothetical protein
VGFIWNVEAIRDMKIEQMTRGIFVHQQVPLSESRSHRASGAPAARLRTRGAGPIDSRPGMIYF